MVLAVGMEPVVVVTDDLDADALATGNLRRRGGSSRRARCGRRCLHNRNPVWSEWDRAGGIFTVTAMEGSPK